MNEAFEKHSVSSPADIKRGQDRDSLFLKAILRFPSSEAEGEVRIRNLSAGGLMAEAPVRVTRGEKAEVNLRNIGWISGSVAWVTEGRIGIAFDHPIDPKAARKPTGSNQADKPLYLKKLDEASKIKTDPSRLRRI
ncbi:PilZ domain-containing protein [Sphingorhabdus arenilitoris]|uniref:PilZ domain-containing protein n=1 Tax=Sphingorhabdus arenilitoris TaxID=1490041 RepID=A0ABV8RE37_9SPHN